MQIIPLFDRVLLKPIEEQNTTQSGLILYSNAARLPKAQVISLGSGICDNGTKKQAFGVKPGDIVLFEEHTANKITLGKENFYLIKEIDIIGVLVETSDN